MNRPLSLSVTVALIVAAGCSRPAADNASGEAAAGESTLAEDEATLQGHWRVESVDISLGKSATPEMADAARRSTDRQASATTSRRSER